MHDWGNKLLELHSALVRQVQPRIGNEFGDMDDEYGAAASTQWM